jgi:predicted transcriptional regulator
MMKRLTEGSVEATRVAEVMGVDDVDRAERLVASLITDGLVERVGRSYRLSERRR